MAAKSIETAFIAFGIVDTATIRDIVGKLELAAVTTIRTQIARKLEWQVEEQIHFVTSFLKIDNPRSYGCNFGHPHLRSTYSWMRLTISQ